MIIASQIKEHMEVKGSDGKHGGTVLAVEHGRLKGPALGFTGRFDFVEPFGVGVANGGVARGGRTAFGFELENEQRVGFDGVDRLVSESDLHEIWLLGLGSVEGGACFGVLFLGFLGGALVVQFLAAGDGDLHFDAAVLEIHLGSDDGEALFPGLGVDFGYFQAVKQQFPFAMTLLQFTPQLAWEQACRPAPQTRGLRAET